MSTTTTYPARPAAQRHLLDWIARHLDGVIMANLWHGYSCLGEMDDDQAAEYMDALHELLDEGIIEGTVDGVMRLTDAGLAMLSPDSPPYDLWLAVTRWDQQQTW